MRFVVYDESDKVEAPVEKLFDHRLSRPSQCHGGTSKVMIFLGLEWRLP